MALRASLRPQRPFGGQRSARRATVVVYAAALRRRDALLGTGAVLASPLLLDAAAWAEEGSKYRTRYIPVDQLGNFQKADQKTEFRVRAETTLKKYVDSSDSSACIRLALRDAGTYDEATKTGGANGSIVLSSGALDDDLKPIVEKLRKAKADIDGNDKNGAGPISWADTIYLAAKVSTQQSWDETKIARAQIKSGGETIVQAFGNPWVAKLGRVDSDVRAGNKIPAADAPVEEIQKYLLQLGAKPGGGPFAPKPPFWEKPGFVIWTAAALDPAAEEARFAAASPVYADIKKEYDVSRKSVTRTNYEVDFIEFFNRLYNLGAVYNPNAYLYPQPILDISGGGK